jgi:protocatechuate 3,4-dioxygenase beta subunit
MKKRDFIRKTLAGFGGIVALPIAGCETKGNQLGVNNENCEISPRETRGPFPIKTPAELVRANIIGDRKGVALLINLKVQSQSESCGNLSGVNVDVWHCDAQGYYSEYGGNRLQQKDLSNEHFLRGRQTTNENGEVSFISIFPGWYPGRAPHIHLDVVKDGDIILTTQIAFPEAITSEVYASSGYRGKEDTPNERDGIFRGSLDGNMADSVDGNLKDGYTLTKVITVA